MDRILSHPGDGLPDRGSPRRPPPPFYRRFLPALLSLLSLLGSPFARAEIQFDVFLGFDDRIREGHWFPAAFEILNDGPTFKGTVVLGPDSNPESMPRTFSLELPTGTRKRVVFPVFSASGRYSRWEARLLDASGKTVADRDNLQPRDTAIGIPIFGALPRSFGGLPALPAVPKRGPEFVPAVARLQTDFLPSNPIALEALSAIYLNSEKAGEIKPEQVDAILAWIHQGGHLIVAIEQATEVNALPWLRAILPFAPESLTNLPAAAGFESWLNSRPRPLLTPPSPRSAPQPNVRRPAGGNRASRLLSTNSTVPLITPAQVQAPVDPFKPDLEFASAELPVMSGRALDGEVLIASGPTPLVISASRGRGLVTALAFSPERDPFRSWKNRSHFWARLVRIPPEFLAENDQLRWGGTSIDGIFGAMLDSRQVRKLPVPALLGLLLVYLLVIGPFDQWILKRTNKQMWTWLTFPAYVVLFSALIYFIGYRLRAGDLEWNEIQVVDQLPRGDGAALRGRTWGSLYSPVNARYRFASDQNFATFRSEFLSSAGRGGEAGKLDLRQPARGFDADAHAAVWVNQLYASDWLEAGPVLVTGQVAPGAAGAKAFVKNKSELRLERVVIAYAGRVHELGSLAPGQEVERILSAQSGIELDEIVSRAPQTVGIVNQRRSAFGGERSGVLDRNLDGVILASFSQRTSGAAPPPSGEWFSAPAGFDANPFVDRGEAMLLAWAPEQSVAGAIQRFAPTRSRRDTVLRALLPVSSTRTNPPASRPPPP